MEDKYAAFNMRKKQSETKVIVGGVIIAVGIILAMLGNMNGNALFIIGIIIGLGGFVFFGIGMAAFGTLKKNFKEQVLRPMFQEAIPDIKYEPTLGLAPQIVYSTDFLKVADRFHSEDHLSGQLDGVQFISSDVKLEERHVEHTKNGTRVYYVPYFIGRVFRFQFNKEFVGSLYVLESGSPMRRGYNKVKLESIDFNKKFKTFATEEITAFYILTPDIMEAIHNLERRHQGRIGLSFHGDYLYVAINNNRDTFEVQMFRKIDESMIKEFQQDLLVIKDFIMTLKLNNNLFKK
ncbi:MAG: DUF3137 domain-containing protein [Bacilli bacterium]|nr:DUF3137 domain-containing protein [Bacilli bacterium]MBN2876122.1 DUF3137 domain-containing protein [Bacilli bacterium]